MSIRNSTRVPHSPVWFLVVSQAGRDTGRDGNGSVGPESNDQEFVGPESLLGSFVALMKEDMQYDSMRNLAALDDGEQQPLLPKEYV
jgi:hypothetical protein